MGLELQAIQDEAQTNQDQILNFPIFDGARVTSQGAIASLQSFLLILTTNQQFLDRAVADADARIVTLGAASVSSSPLNNVPLADALLETRVKVVEALTSLSNLATQGSVRYTEIISDVNLQITNIQNAAGATLRPAIVEARDELIEAGPDGASRLEVVRVAAFEGVSAVTENLDRVRGILQGFPSNQLSPFLQAFVAMTQG